MAFAAGRGKGENTMLVANYKTKKMLKESIGKVFRFTETSLFGPEFKPNTMLTVVGPSAYKREWYAQVWTDESYNITKVK
jgi:hypothetical protein